MLLQKNMIICSLILMILSILGIIFLDSDSKLFNISVGLFTGTVLTMLTSVILYNFEKKKLLNKTNAYFSEIYYILETIYFKLGKFLEEKNITDMNFSLNYKLAMQISEKMKYLKKEVFTSFLDFKTHKLIKKLNSFMDKLYNLENIIAMRNINILQFEIALKQPNLNDNQCLFKYREDLLIAIGRLHEYSCSLKIELDEIMTEFDAVCKFSNSWEDKKQCFYKTMAVIKNDL